MFNFYGHKLQYDKHNLTFVIILYDEKSSKARLKLPYEMTTHERSSLYIMRVFAQRKIEMCPTLYSEKSSITLVCETLVLASVVAQWL